MAVVRLDALGLRCPQPVLKIAVMGPQMAKGDILEVSGDCPTFEQDVKKWCERTKRTLLAVTREGEVKIAQIQF
jgi:tRNA 2-thiouridine synthesizing protein A